MVCAKIIIESHVCQVWCMVQISSPQLIAETEVYPAGEGGTAQLFVQLLAAEVSKNCGWGLY